MAEQGRVQLSQQAVSRIHAAAVFVQHREDVFVHQEDPIGLFVGVVDHQTLQGRNTMAAATSVRPSVHTLLTGDEPSCNPPPPQKEPRSGSFVPVEPH